MSLRIKLLLIFVVSELCLLAFFGYVAYDTAKVTNTNNEIDILASVAPRIADDIAHDMKEGDQQWGTSLMTENQAQHADLIYLFVKDKDGHLISQPELPVIQYVYQELNKQVAQNSTIHFGNLTVDDIVYVWARSLVPTYEHQLTVLRQAHASHASIFFKEMGVSLIVAAAIMLWVATWAAMYVSMLIEKLDEQKNILAHRSLHDVLTGLPNRALLNDRLQQLITTNEHQPIQFGICFIDLNRFKDVNDTLGHHVGDELLLEVSKRLKAMLRKSDTVARLGGDEFALIFRDVDVDQAKSLAEKILETIEIPVEVCGHKLFVSGSLGIAMHPKHGKDVHILLKKADVAMYAAKRLGSHLEFYNDNHKVFTRDKLALTQDLREAIDSNQLELYYQPKYNSASQNIVGAEALLRWKHPAIGFIPPPTFIQLAEYSGLIHPLSKWVVERAFRDSIELSHNGFDIPISLNLSAYNLQDPKFESEIMTLLEGTGVDANKIILELTESAMVSNPMQTRELLMRMTKQGFRISVDDFGTGFSTLTNLRRMPISEIKIDRSFVGNIISDPDDASIVKAMIGLGQSLELDVIAEGVETQEVLDALKQFGCFTIQGYLISKPVPLSNLLEWMQEKNVQYVVQGNAAI